MHEQRTETIAFGPFEWNAARAELRRGGARVRLTGQPLQILIYLLDHADRVVTREELRDRLWGGKGAYLDFEQGLNTAVARLRQALGDSAESPRFVETVPGLGYRFVAPVTGPDRKVEPVAMAPPVRMDRRILLAGGLGLVLGAAGGYFTHAGAPRSSVTGRPRRFSVSGPPAPPLVVSGGFADVAMAPDGRHIAYRTAVGGASRLHVRSLANRDGLLLPEADVYSPFFSPDGSEIGYYKFTGHALLRAPIAGGPPSLVAEVSPFVAGACWTADGHIVFATADVSVGLLRVPAGGGSIETLTRPDTGENHVLPEGLPGGQFVLFTVVAPDAADESRIALLDLDTGRYRILTPGSQPRYAVSGHLLYLIGADLMAVRFDARRGVISGTPAVAASPIETSTGLGMLTGQYSPAADGSLLVAMRSQAEERRIVWVTRDGTEQVFPAAPRGYTYPRVAPDGRRVALNMRDSRGGEIEIWDITRADATPLTIGHGVSLYPVWTPDSASLAYVSGLPFETRLYLRSADGDGPAEAIDAHVGQHLRALYFFTPSGRDLVFARQADQGAEVRMMTLNEPQPPSVLVRNARNADLSPDGRHVAFQSDASGRFEVYVRPFPDVDAGYMKVSADGGVQPVWSPRGDALFYVEPGPRARLMAVSVEQASSLVLSRPRPLLDWPYYTAELGRTFDVSRPDGERFLAVTSADGGAASVSQPQVEILLDWLQTLAARVP